MPHAEVDVLRRALQDAFGDPAGQLEVHPDSLPPSGPAPLPPLDGFTLLGSVSSLAPMDHFSASVFLESSLPPEDSERQLGEALLGAGWEGGWHTFPHPVGFLNAADAARERSAQSGPPHFFVHHASRCVAFLQGRNQEEDTSLTLRLETGHAYEHHAGQREDPSAALPLLPVPSGITAQTLGGGAGESSVALHARTAALLSGTGTVAELQQHFADELTRQGWTRGEEAGNEALWSSLWQRTAESGVWLGSLLLVRLADGEWQAQFDVLQRRPRQDANLGWSSYTL